MFHVRDLHLVAWPWLLLESSGSAASTCSRIEEIRFSEVSDAVRTRQRLHGDIRCLYMRMSGARKFGSRVGTQAPARQLPSKRQTSC